MRRLNLTKSGKRRAIVALAAGLVLTLTACEGEPSAKDKENQSNAAGYEDLVAAQPGKSMSYSPTRETINFWVETWNKPNKLSYVYLQNANGDLIGYYVLKGLPVTSCAALKPTVEVREDDTGGNLLVPQPSVDGVYYSGGQCNTYYGKDASSGAYIEYTVGLGINVLLYDQPLARQDVQPLGPTTIK